MLICLCQSLLDTVDDNIGGDALLLAELINCLEKNLRSSVSPFTSYYDLCIRSLSRAFYAIRREKLSLQSLCCINRRNRTKYLRGR